MRIVTLMAAAAVATPAWAQTKAAEPIPQSVWALKDGVYEHLQSGLRCPASLPGGFSRAGVTTYDGFGFDVSCGWNGPNAILTAYLVRNPDIRPAFESARKSLEE